MMFHSQRLALLLLTLLAPAARSETPATSYEDAIEHARIIRIAKMANDWKGKRITLERFDGRHVKGRLATVYGNRFILKDSRNQRAEVDIASVSLVRLHPGRLETLFGGVIGLGIGATTAGVIQLGADATPTATWIGGASAFALGTILGIRLTHRETVIRLALSNVESVSGRSDR